MFPKIHRFDVRSDKDFFKTAKRKNFPYFQCLYQESESLEPQFAVIVPKKVSKKATSRHKLLRQMRAILMENKKQFQHKQLVVVIFYRALDKTYQELAQSVQRASL